MGAWNSRCRKARELKMPGCQGLGGGLASGDDELQRRVETRPVAAGSGHEGLTSSSHEPRTRVVRCARVVVT